MITWSGFSWRLGLLSSGYGLGAYIDYGALTCCWTLAFGYLPSFLYFWKSSSSLSFSLTAWLTLKLTFRICSSSSSQFSVSYSIASFTSTISCRTCSFRLLWLSQSSVIETTSLFRVFLSFLLYFLRALTLFVSSRTCSLWRRYSRSRAVHSSYSASTCLRRASISVAWS